jgi:hypothetical protein
MTTPRIGRPPLPPDRRAVALRTTITPDTMTMLRGLAKPGEPLGSVITRALAALAILEVQRKEAAERAAARRGV